MTVLPLHGDRWTVRTAVDTRHVPDALRAPLAAGVAAAVPGCVHTDLMAAGLLEDPYLADNELRQFWIGRTDWQYTCSFGLDDATLGHDRLDLACDGLDTLASLTLNGVPIGTAENMHRRYRFDLRPAARPGPNELSVTFAAPVPFAEAEWARTGRLPHTGHGSNTPHPHNMLRKMACNMGWDWGPDVTTSGIWRPIRLEAWDGLRIRDVRLGVTDLTHARAKVNVFVDTEIATDTPEGRSGYDITVAIESPDLVDGFGADDGAEVCYISNPQLWWPAGHGAQPLYTVHVDVRDHNGKSLERVTRRIGLRTAELRHTPDPAPVGDPIPGKQGESMTLYVNGKPIYCKGADWIPDDCFPHRVTPARYAERIAQARDANMNMLRVWGGGLFEDDCFYELCDQLGVMVWQDFLFACAFYPEHAAYRDNVEAEVRDNVARLASHPSLVVWNGCNENIWGAHDWNEPWVGIRRANTQPWGLGYYLDLLPRLVAELAPGAPYWPASPYSGNMDRHPNLNEFGNVHIWDVWHGPGQYRNYLGHYPRLATEFGYHGPAAYATIAAAVPADQRQWDSPLMQLHNKNHNPGQLQTHTRLADDFDPPTDDYDAWHFLAQVMQARGLSMGVEWFRALFPWNSGALYWQLNDCYPVSSWSAIDSGGRAKPLLHASRRFFAPRLVTIKPRRVTPAGEPVGALRVYLHNDHDDRWAGPCVLRQMTLVGEIVAEQAGPIDVPPRSLATVDVPEPMRGRPTDTFLVAAVGPHRGFWWFTPDKQMSYPPPAFDAELSRPRAGTYELTVTARSVLRDLCLFPDRLDPAAGVSDGCVTLLPGDRFTFTIDSDAELTRDALVAPPVMDCVNRYGAAVSSSRPGKEGLATDEHR